MKNHLFNIDESEKRRILEMHETATKKQYLGEQQAATTPATPTTNQKTKMSPLATDKITLTDGSSITLYPTWNQQGTEKQSTFTVKGDYTIDPKTRKESTNFVKITMSNNEIPGFNIGVNYDCTSKQIVDKFVQSPTDVGSMKNAKYKLTTGGQITSKINSVQYPDLVQSHIRQMIDKTGLSTTDSPVSDVIQYYCPTT